LPRLGATEHNYKHTSSVGIEGQDDGVLQTLGSINESKRDHSPTTHFMARAIENWEHGDIALHAREKVCIAARITPFTLLV
jgi:hypothetical protein